MARLCQRLVLCLVLAAGLLLPAVPARCCPFCSAMQGTTLTAEIGQASLVVYGELVRTRLSASNGDLGEGQTELAVQTVLKSHELIKGHKTVLLDRVLPAKPGTHLLVFCDIFKGKIDPYRLAEIQNGNDLIKYLQGALENKNKKIATRLRFYFDYLDNSDVEISNDAYREFANASYDDYKTMARSLPADRIAGWLKDTERTPNYRLGLYASMLGHCGTRKHAQDLRKLLDNQEKKLNTGIDGVLAAYIMLQPQEGWQYLCEALEDAAKNDFSFRYAGLRTLRFFWDSRPDLVSREKIRGVLLHMLEQKDIADMVIEDLRKWHCWDLAPRVLAVQDSKAYEVPIVRRAILRFCLSCPPDNTQAARYVAQERRNDSEAVSDIEGNLKLEQAPPASSAAARK